jgi:hypothetical protein
MKLGAPSLVLAGLFVACSSAIADAQTPNTAAPAAAATPPPVSAPPPPTDRPRDAAHADARVCLEFPTALQVIACAEKYRPAKRR